MKGYSLHRVRFSPDYVSAVATDDAQSRKDRGEVYRLRVWLKANLRIQLLEQGVPSSEVTARIRRVGQVIKQLEFNDVFAEARGRLRGEHWERFLNSAQIRLSANEHSTESESEGDHQARGSRE